MPEALPAEIVVQLVLSRTGPLYVSVKTPRIFQHAANADIVGVRASLTMQETGVGWGGGDWCLRLSAAGLLPSTEQNQH